MTDPFARLRGFLRELKRRTVYKVAVAGLVAAFSANEAVDVLRPGEGVANLGDREAAPWTT